MVGGIALINCSDAILKYLSAGYPIGEIVVLRGLVVLAVIGSIAARTQDGFRVVDRRGQALRALFAIGATFFFIFGISRLPLADNVAMTFSGPLMITALAAAMLGEPVGWRRWTAVGVGFVGVVIMLRPGGEAFHWAMLFPLGTAVCGSLRDIVTRRISVTDGSLSIMFVSTAALVFVGLLTLPFAWRTPSVVDGVLLLTAGLILSAAQFLLIDTFRHAEASLVAPFKYFGLIWATVIGYLVWGDIPDRWLTVGAFIVVASGLYILHRETRSGGAPAA